ncbi:MAG: alpha/beta fold hydrolase [Desulfopila sp.]
MLSFRHVGKGDLQVMVVHGWKTDHRCYEGLFPSLDGDIATYVFVDQRGYGKSMELAGPYTVMQVAADMLELADHLGWRTFHVIGHSMGGKVIQRLMADYPGRISSAIGITPCPAAKIPFDAAGWDLFAAAAVSQKKREEIFRLSTADRYTDSWYHYITGESVAMSRPEAFRAYLDSWVNDDLVSAIAGCTTPIKVIVGRNDPDLNEEVIRQTYGVWLPNCEIVVLEKCGHYPMLECPLELAAEIENFLQRHR